MGNVISSINILRCSSICIYVNALFVPSEKLMYLVLVAMYPVIPIVIESAERKQYYNMIGYLTICNSKEIAAYQTARHKDQPAGCNLQH